MKSTLRDAVSRRSLIADGKTLLKSFFFPTIDRTKKYGRLVSCGDMTGLIAGSQGSVSLYKRGGEMSLLIDISREGEDGPNGYTLEPQVIQKYTDAMRELEDTRTIRQLCALVWLIDAGKLTIYTIKRKEKTQVLPKLFLFENESGDKVAAVGTGNETVDGIGGSNEILTVARSWKEKETVEDLYAYFDRLWDPADEDGEVTDITDRMTDAIIRGMGEKFVEAGDVAEDDVIWDLYREAAELPMNYFVSGEIPALFQHQERAVLDALSRWPVRALFADEVGLGKTFECGATIRYLMKYGGVKRVVILTPKSVLQQWQDELKTHFGIDAWRFDPQANAYVSPDGIRNYIYGTAVVDEESPDVMLISAQYARGTGRSKPLFEKPGTVLPDMLILDEAHAARVTMGLRGMKETTKLYDLIESVAGKIPHLILATATPMQKDPCEYHGLLKLLGLPPIWRKDKNYDLSLKVLSEDHIPDITDAYTVAKLIRATVRGYEPDRSHLTEDEREGLERLLEEMEGGDEYLAAETIQRYWPAYKKIFVKLHPAHLLTVRNTRRSLERQGYVFPKRELHEVSIGETKQIRELFNAIDSYLSDICFSTEEYLVKADKGSIGFLRIAYRQRIASSLWSCKRSLERREGKLERIKNKWKYEERNDLLYMEVDEQDEDTTPDMDWGIEKQTDEIDVEELYRRINIERSMIGQILRELDDLLEETGDEKIRQAIDVATEHMEKGDRVLVFTRYADTVEALVNAYEGTEPDRKADYGIYSGQGATLVTDSGREKVTKDRIRKELDRGGIGLLFCTDAASEGLNLQSARVLINVDVPWTPSRLEQRIGRIARMGQIAPSVDIYNIWYPDSIEAKMYRMIRKRAEDAEIAVGEFPDIIADKIKRYVMDEEETDDSAEELRRIRTSTQTKALDELWTDKSHTETVSTAIRRHLLEAAKHNSKKAHHDDETGMYRLVFYDRKQIRVTDRPGMEESISYKTLADAGVMESAMEHRIRYGDEERPIAVIPTDGREGYIDAREIPMIPYLRKAPGPISDGCRPVLVPDNGKLDLTGMVEGEAPKRPEWWIGGEG